LPELERLRQASGLHLSQSQQEEARKRSDKLKLAIANQTHALHKLVSQFWVALFGSEVDC
jgi:hypothetical protein